MIENRKETEDSVVEVILENGHKVFPASPSSSTMTVNEVKERLKLAGGDILLCLASMMKLHPDELKRTEKFGTVKERIVCKIAQKAMDGDEVSVDLIFNRLCGKQKAHAMELEQANGGTLEDFIARIEAARRQVQGPPRIGTDDGRN
jgi:hypothetical protein